jgi:hypothetical protein
MVRKLESLDPYQRRGDGETGRNNSHRVYVNRPQGNDTVLVETKLGLRGRERAKTRVGKITCEKGKREKVTARV